ncbi:MAG: c-type cytochrome [Acidobacteria bacterium Pan2503]|uniref:C-type cytochrome n=1 Tax=Candidatus Acidiferrum panamense TaxID=2741543 RepID=A0A7V8NTM8_9BACT|nr:c-type cytochrome [Candidatus Acidoferrum panamensis]
MLMYTRSRQCRAGKLPAFSLALIFSFGLSNCAIWPQLHAQEKARAQQEPENAATLDRGRKLFEQSCGFCHGPDATGARGPDLVRSPLVAHDVHGNLIGDVIRHGRPDKGMPPIATMVDEDVTAIAAFLHARALEAIESAGVPLSYPVEKLLTGNAETGKAFFNGAGGCKNCHSPTGDLAAIATKYSPIELEAHMLYPGGRQATAQATAVVTLPSGEQIKGPLEHVDDFMISLRDASGWYRSFSRDRVKVEVQDPLTAHRELLGKLTQAEVHNLFAYLETLR